MGKVVAEISMSLDGFVAGPNQTLDEPLGEGGEQLHDWVFPLKAWRERHGLSGGETTSDNELVEESLASTGATVMGRRMFSGGEGPWEDDPKADGWWGDDPPFRHPVFVLTHHPREALTKQGGTSFTFVTEGAESAVEQAKVAAGDKQVAIGGGATAIREAISAGVVDELEIHLVPVLLGDGVRLLDGLGDQGIELHKARVVDGPAATHLRFRVAR